MTDIAHRFKVAADLSSPMNPVPSEPNGRIAPPRLVEHYALRPDAVLATSPTAVMSLRSGRYETTLTGIGLAGQEILRRFAAGWLGQPELGRVASSAEGQKAIIQAQLLVRGLLRQGWLSKKLGLAERDLIEVVPHVMGKRKAQAARAVPDVAYQLSRHCVITDVDGRFALRPYDWKHTVVLDDGRLLAAIAGSMPGRTLAQLAGDAQLDEAVLVQVVTELLTVGVLLPYGAENPALQYWDSSELATQFRSRAGAHMLPIGGTFRFRERAEPEPLAKDRPTGPFIELPRPAKDGDLMRLPLEDVIAGRRSIRDHDPDNPISLSKLSEFLFCTQHTSQVVEAAGQQVGIRPYPGGGRICELEMYLLVNNCTGLPAGVYWYDSLAHGLCLLAEPNQLSATMLGYARAASAAQVAPQVLCVITSRIARLAWKYEGLAYSMSLRNAGVLMAHMYLIATALQLAPCALGTGDSAAFAALTGIDPLAEPVVGDFMLGSIGGRR